MRSSSRSTWRRSARSVATGPRTRTTPFARRSWLSAWPGHANGVSRLHGKVTRQQWGGLWPRLPLDEVPIGHVTDGVHFKSWISDEIEDLLDRELGLGWRTTPGSPDSWMPLIGAGDEGLWQAKCQARTRLIEFTRTRRNEQLARRGADGMRLAAAESLLDPDALTIGFVGRFVAYKRPTLFLRDPERLARILGDPERPVQIIFGGKAHPRDESGKGLLREVIEFAQNHGLEHRVVFIEDFDLTMDRALAQGVDLWLNTPRRPLEACGMGGMKAGENGALNFSTLDGWWDEVWNDADPVAAPIGWCIGTGRPYEDFAPAGRERRRIDVRPVGARNRAPLLRPGRGGFAPRMAGLDSPVAWPPSPRRGMSHRMVHDYVESFYLPGAHRAAWLAAEGDGRARELATALERFRIAWPAVHVAVVDVIVAPGGGMRAEITAELGVLEPSEVIVQLWVAPTQATALPAQPHTSSRTTGPSPPTA